MNDIVDIKTYDQASLESLANSISKDVINGDIEAVPAFMRAKAIKLVAELIIEDTKDSAMGEMELYGKDESTYNGANFSLSSSGNTLNYEDDEEYSRLDKELKARKKKLKKAFDMSQVGEALIDKATGEETPVVSIKKHSEQIIKVSFK